MKTLKTTSLGVLAAALVAAGSGAPLRAATDPPQYTLFDLGAGAAAGINDAGQVAVNAVFPAPARVSRRHVEEDGTIVSEAVVGILPSNGYFVAYGIGLDGTIVGEGNLQVQADGSDPTDFYYVGRACTARPGQASNLGFVGSNGFEHVGSSAAHAVNASGLVVGDTFGGFIPPEFTDTYAQQYQRAATFGGTGPAVLVEMFSSARAVNSAGKIVGWSRGALGQRVTLWFQGSQFDVDVPGSLSGAANAINDHDQVVGYRTATSGFPAEHAFVLQLNGTAAGANTVLAELPGGNRSSAEAINDAGVVVGSSGTAAGDHAVMWLEGQVHDLNGLVDPESPGLPADGSAPLLRSANGINAAGEIACTGEIAGPSGTTTHAFLLRPAGVLAVSPRLIDFGTVVTGQSADQPVTIRNTGAEPLTVVLVKPGAPFRVASPRTFKLAPGAQRVVQVSAAPKTAGEGDLAGEFSVGLGEKAVVVTLVAKAVKPESTITASPGLIDFGEVYGTPTAGVTLTNVGNVAVRALLGIDKPFAVGARSVSLAPGGSASVGIACVYRGPGDYAGTLFVANSLKGGNGTSVALTGHGAHTVRLGKPTGRVEVQRGGGGWEPAVAGMYLREGDRIHTGWKATIQAQYPDGSSFEEKPMSMVTLGAMTVDGATTSNRVLLRLGEVRAQVHRSTGAAGDFNVKTPTTTASVRGTKFSVLYDAVAGVTVVSVTEHSVEVAPESGDAVIVPEGMEVESTATEVGPVAKIGAAGTPAGGMSRGETRAKLLAIFAKAEKACGLDSKESDVGMLPVAEGWDILVTTNRGASHWTARGLVVKPADAAAQEIADRCR